MAQLGSAQLRAHHGWTKWRKSRKKSANPDAQKICAIFCASGFALFYRDFLHFVQP